MQPINVEAYLRKPEQGLSDSMESKSKFCSSEQDVRELALRFLSNQLQGINRSEVNENWKVILFSPGRGAVGAFALWSNPEEVAKYAKKAWERLLASELEG